MRPLRFILSLATCIIAFFLLLYSGPWRASTSEDFETHNSIGAYFNWRTPSSLFPPSAIISLTDDNSTFFLARPAAFGPLLPSKSLSGQLWVGSGFGDDRLGRGGSAGAEGELGCSDIPEWDDGAHWSGVGGSKRTGDDTKLGGQGAEGSKTGKIRRTVPVDAEVPGEKHGEQPDQDDGTDDHLHHPLPPSAGLKTNGEPAGYTKKPAHADIQSLQEGAEIAGKVVLLSRGGCGFLEKVKWVQRRGGVALIVGDDVRGGPLVTMYARGDTSNVTIPSLFTSHMTAHLLSSLIPSGGMLDDLSAEEVARLGLALKDQKELSKIGKAKSNAADKPNFTTTSAVVKSTAPANARVKDHATQSETTGENDAVNEREADVGWLRSWLGGRASRTAQSDSSRPPSSGNIDWVLKDFEEEDVAEKGRVGRHATSSTSPPRSAKTKDSDSSDGFVIGIQDWRDKDLVAEQKERQTAQVSSSSSVTSAIPSEATKSSALKGGSITPGSGEYSKSRPAAIELASTKKSAAAAAEVPDRDHSDAHKQSPGNWLSKLLHKSSEAAESATSDKVAATASELALQSRLEQQHQHHQLSESTGHEGLWVTLTPTSMSSSPFFDTLLVLVVSPLVTLTVVYALLLLRSRIRRRRWRAPKSVVERLPVRTYQTMPSTSPTASTMSSVSAPATVCTPLLPTTARPISARARPRSRTASEVPIQPSASVRSDDMAAPSLEHVEERRAAGLAEWRRRYGGKQRECVVCLEEYVDGVSRVMSLPCGHEFHAECITPWLTTRRRTCPICKGDVVRSLARSNNATTSSSSPLQTPYHDNEDTSDDVQEQAAATRNDDPAAAQPVSREDEAFEDLEQGLPPDTVDRTR